MATWPDGTEVGRTAAQWESYLQRGINIEEFSAVGDARQITDAAITSGTNIVTSATAVFSASDAGKTMSIKNAVSTSASLVSPILQVVNTTTVLLVDNATRTVSGVGATIGTPNGAQLSNALAYQDADVVYIPDGVFMTVGTFNFNISNQTIYFSRNAVLLTDGSGADGRAYNVTANGVTMCGKGAIDGNISCTSASNAGAGAWVIGARSRTSFSLYDVTIQNGAAFGVVLNDSSHVTIRRATFTNCAGAGSVYKQDSTATTDVVVEGCSIDNSMVTTIQGGSTTIGSGIAVGAGITHPPDRVRITNNTVIAPPSNTANLGTASGCIGGAITNGIISNNTCVGGRIAISPEFSTAITVSNNVVNSPLDYGIEIPAVAGASVTGNMVDGGGTCVFGIVVDAVGGLATNISITGNNVRNMGTTGTEDGITVQNANRNVVITGNYVEMAAGTAIGTNATPGVLIANNRLENTATAVNGVFAAGSGDITISGNQLTGDFTNPVSLFESAPATRDQIVVIGNSSDSVLTVNKTVNLTLGSNCKVFGNGGDVALTGI